MIERRRGGRDARIRLLIRPARLKVGLVPGLQGLGQENAQSEQQGGESDDPPIEHLGSTCDQGNQRSNPGEEGAEDESEQPAGESTSTQLAQGKAETAFPPTELEDKGG